MEPRTTRQQYPLSPLKPLKKTISAVIGWIILFIIILAIGVPITIAIASSGNYNIPSSWYILTAIGILLFLSIITVIEYTYQKLYFNVYFYDLNDSFIVIKKGVITPKEISIPYERVQDIYVDQDIWDRIFHLYDVHLSSATYTSGMEAHIDGVGKEAAAGLRTMLLSTINEKIHRRPDVQAPSTYAPTT